MQSKIILTTDITANAHQVFEVITTQAGLAGWYTPEAKVDGTQVELRFGQLTTLKFAVREVEIDQRVVWSGVQVPADWRNTRITFTIATDGTMAHLTFVQDGLPQDYQDLGSFAYLWAQYLRSIKMLVETGSGEPFGSKASRQAGTTPSGAF